MQDGPPPNPSNGAVAAGGRAGRNLPLAVASGVGLAAVFLVSLLWHPLVLLALIFALVVVALLELDSAFASRRARPATPVVIAVAAVALFGTYAVGPGAQALSLALLLLGGAVWSFLAGGGHRAVEVIGATLLVGVWVPFLASFASLLVERPGGSWYVLAAIALAVVTDISAYGFGSVFGRHKLAPRISPGKTWEGLAGGALAALLVAALALVWIPGLDLPSALLLAVAVSLAATLGDLTESLVKRDLGVKDLGRILPGHGGIMDRVDSIIFSLPAAHFTLAAVGL